jgi:hypothetical protein
MDWRVNLPLTLLALAGLLLLGVPPAAFLCAGAGVLVWEAPKRRRRI